VHGLTDFAILFGNRGNANASRAGGGLQFDGLPTMDRRRAAEVLFDQRGTGGDRSLGDESVWVRKFFLAGTRAWSPDLVLLVVLRRQGRTGGYGVLKDRGSPSRLQLDANPDGNGTLVREH
jgi:hypothetical protein